MRVTLSANACCSFLCFGGDLFVCESVLTLGGDSVPGPLLCIVQSMFKSLWVWEWGLFQSPCFVLFIVGHSSTLFSVDHVKLQSRAREVKSLFWQCVVDYWFGNLSYNMKWMAQEEVFFILIYFGQVRDIYMSGNRSLSPYWQGWFLLSIVFGSQNVPILLNLQTFGQFDFVILWKCVVYSCVWPSMFSMKFMICSSLPWSGEGASGLCQHHGLLPPALYIGLIPIDPNRGLVCEYNHHVPVSSQSINLSVRYSSLFWSLPWNARQFCWTLCVYLSLIYSLQFLCSNFLYHWHWRFVRNWNSQGWPVVHL